MDLDLGLIPDSVAGALPVHHAGLPVELQRWQPGSAVVVEDAADALGARTRAGPVGNCAHSDMCCFSFRPVKPITSAEGGLVTTNNDDLADRLRRFRSHGIVRKPEQGGWCYEISEVGFNYRLTDVQAALGLSQLGKLNQFSIRRNEIAEAYRGPLADLPIELPLAAPTGFMHGYHLFAVLVSNRRQTYGCLLEAGISTQAHYVPVHHHPVSADIGMKPGDLPVCDRVYEGCLSLSMFPGLNDGDIDTVVKALRAGVGD